MATSMMSRALVLFLIAVPILFVSSEARVLLPKFSTMMSTKKVRSELLLRDLVNNLRNGGEYYRHKRSMLQGGKLERMSPAGPDPQHH